MQRDKSIDKALKPIRRRSNNKRRDNRGGGGGSGGGGGYYSNGCNSTAVEDNLICDWCGSISIPASACKKSSPMYLQGMELDPCHLRLPLLSSPYISVIDQY
ncbi:conserved hypothetical protein [Ricinus communis]|uniref:Uncharacterized protein n=1 Tax=Ricinus communis TaxID=3988 RepID=B9RRA0_RICCO|nr:conserved hypothetical protein [Ricinus communis]